MSNFSLSGIYNKTIFFKVNLRQGLPQPSVAENCPAGAGSLILEFGLLSRLLDDPVYEGYARRANKVLWDLREKSTGLLGKNLKHFLNVEESIYMCVCVCVCVKTHTHIYVYIWLSKKTFHLFISSNYIERSHLFSFLFRYTR